MAIDKSDYKRVFASVFTPAQQLLQRAQQPPDAFSQYLQSWQQVAEKAAELDNFALQDVVLLFIDACAPVFKTSQDADSLSDEQWQLLKKWDDLFASYINSPENQQLALALIQCLNDPLLAIGLEPEDEQILLSGFLPVIEQLIANIQDTAEQNANDDDAPLSIWEKLRLLFQQVNTHLQEILAAQANDSDESYAESLKHYLASWTAIAKVIDNEQDQRIAKYLDLVLPFINLNNQLFNENDRLNHEQQTLLKQWHNLFGLYIKAQGSQQLAVALVKCLGHSSWPHPISSTDEKMLLQEFNAIDVPFPQVSASEASPAAVTEQTTEAQISLETTPAATNPTDSSLSNSTNSIWQQLGKPYTDAVLNLKMMVAEPQQQNQQNFVEYLQAYQQNWQQIVKIIQTNEQLTALLELVMLFTKVTSPAFAETNISNQHLARLKKWHGLFGNYIKGRGDQQFVLPLIKCLSDGIWPDAITTETEASLLASFNLPHTLTNPFTPATKNLDFISDTAEPKSLSQASAAKETVIWQQLQQLFSATELNLTAATEKLEAHDETALKASLQHYLESWLVIAQQIEVDGNLLGLLDVVLLFIEVTRQAFEQLKNVDTKQLTLLNKWQSLFNSYLKVQGNRQLAVSLIKCLSDPLWSAAIMSEDEEMLLSGFTDNEFPIEASDEAELELSSTDESQAVFEEIPEFTLTEEAEPEIEFVTEAESLSVIEETPEFGLPEVEQAESAVEFITEQESLPVVEEPVAFTLIEEAEPEVEFVTEEESLPVIEETPEFGLPEVEQTESEVEFITEQESLPVFEEIPEFALTEETKPEIELVAEPAFEETPEFVLSEETESEVEFITEEENLSVIEEAATDEITEDSLANQGRNASIWQEIEPVFNQAALILKAVVDSEIINDTEALQQGLQDYIESWQNIAEIIANDGNLAGLFDVIMLFTEISKQTLLSLDSLSSEQLSLLNNWQSSFSGYFCASNNAAFAVNLVKCLRDPLWAEPIEAEDEQMLLEAMEIEDSQLTALALENEPDLVVDATVEAEKNPLWQNIELFFSEAQSQIQLMQEQLAANNIQTCREYLRQYAEHWLVIAEIIAEGEQNLLTLADISLLFADNCVELVEQKIPLNHDRIQLLSDWQTTFSAYWQDVTSVSQLNALIACLENSYWLRPLTAMDKGMLLEMQAEDNQQPSLAADDENLFSFDEGLFSEEDRNGFALFAEETEQLAEEAPEPEAEEIAWFTEEEEATASITDEVLPQAEDVVLFSEEAEEQEVEEIAWFTEEEKATAPITEEVLPQAEDVVLFAEEATEQEVEEIAWFTEEEKATAPITEEVLPQAEDVTLFEEEATEQEAEVSEALGSGQALPVNPELIGMVRDEFGLLTKELNAEIAEAADAQAFKVVLKNHEFKFENLAKACHTIGLLGLEQVFEQLSLNMRSRRDNDIFTETESELFKAVLPLIGNYIAAINESDKAVALVAHLAAPGWKQSLTEAQIKPLLESLSGLVLSSQTQQLNHRKTKAEPADVSLELPEDVNRELLDSLLNELPVLTGKFSTVIQQIISGHGSTQQLLDAQRIAHTLKGSGNIVGVAGIAVVTHHLEEILEYLTEHKTFPPKALAEVLLESADCLEMMCELMLNGEKQPPDQALPVLQNVLNWANQIATGGLPADDTEVEITTLPAQPDTDITPVVQEAKAAEAVVMTRVPSETIDKLLRMTGEGSILSEQFKERIKRFSEELKNLNELTWHMQSLVSELDQSINIQSYAAKTGRSGVIDTEFDALEMEQYNELHTAASRISEVATDIREINIHMDEQLVDLKYLMIEEDTIQKENQEMVQSIRMVPANTIASRCQRIVRQACRATNKEVELEIKGADILIDSEILNDMVEPLMHLLRNSIDHGIEPLQIREKYNKPKVGKITLEFSRKGNYAVITCKDDGAGLASGNILQTAIKKGLISPKQELTEAEIHKLILIPGFSTRTVATQTSGRGIGMDAIQTKISAIQGQMSLASVRGEGLTIEITIPLTLSSMLSLLVKSAGQTMAISNRGLRKIHHSDECTLVEENGQLYCDIDYKRYPAKYFAELVGMPIPRRAEQKLPALRIEDEIGRTHIVLVEELLGYRDLLVKNMGNYIPHIQGITGASILGNGAVAPVIDLVEMLHHSAKYDYVLADATKALADSINGLPVALVVDDSLSARRAVAMLLKDSGLEVETAIDGLDAIKHLDKGIPDIILVDLEMPRMNGIELTAHVRGREAMKNTPIIMITSRATEKHRKQAEAAGVTKFMTKPFTEDDLVHNVRMLMK